MVEFDIMQSSSPAECMNNDEAFLTSAANWEPSSTRNISTKMVEVESVRRAINTHFNLKARPWQVNVVLDITKYKRDVCAIAETNAGKSLVYQSIPVITGGSVLVILPAIALMEDQVRNSSQTNIMLLSLIVVSMTQYAGLDLKLWHLPQLLWPKIRKSGVRLIRICTM